MPGHEGQLAAAAAANGGLSKLHMSPMASQNGSGAWEEDMDGASPSGRGGGGSRRHRNQPFFVGVAGGTASGELGAAPWRVHAQTQHTASSGTDRAREQPAAAGTAPATCPPSPTPPHDPHPNPRLLLPRRQDHRVRQRHPEAAGCVCVGGREGGGGLWPARLPTHQCSAVARALRPACPPMHTHMHTHMQILRVPASVQTSVW